MSANPAREPPTPDPAAVPRVTASPSPSPLSSSSSWSRARSWITSSSTPSPHALRCMGCSLWRWLRSELSSVCALSITIPRTADGTSSVPASFSVWRCCCGCCSSTSSCSPTRQVPPWPPSAPLRACPRQRSASSSSAGSIATRRSRGASCWWPSLGAPSSPRAW